MKLSVLFRSAMVAFDELTREFSRLETLKILADVQRRNALGLPFKDVPKTDDPKDQATRDELAPAVNLFNVLRERMEEEKAFVIARRIILNSSLLHLRSIYPEIQKGDFRTMGAGDPEQTGQWLGEQFAFAETDVIEIRAEKASFDVTYCRIPSTLALVNAARLGSIFCEVDSIYFPIFEPDANLVRTQTIIRGGTTCDFRLTWK